MAKNTKEVDECVNEKEADEIYIQNYDPVNGSRQKVFAIDKELIGTISSDFYWGLRDVNIERSIK